MQSSDKNILKFCEKILPTKKAGFISILQKIARALDFLHSHTSQKISGMLRTSFIASMTVLLIIQT